MNWTEIEQKRKNCFWMTVIGVLLFIGGFALTMLVGDEPGVFFVILYFLMLGSGIALAVIGATKFKKLKDEFKNKVIPSLVKEVLGDGCTYSAKGGLSESEVFASRIMHKKDRYHSEDLISGSIGDILIRTSDVHIEERHEVHTKEGTQVTYVTTFLGRFIDLTFPRSISGVVVSAEETPTHSGLEKCELEMIQFNKKFKTFADTQHNAFYLLTPPMIEALLRIEEKNKGRIGIEFVTNKVYVAINNNIDTFSLSLVKPINASAIEKFKMELSCIPDIIKEIRTNKLYKGENE